MRVRPVPAYIGFVTRQNLLGENFAKGETKSGLDTLHKQNETFPPGLFSYSRLIAPLATGGIFLVASPDLRNLIASLSREGDKPAFPNEMKRADGDESAALGKQGRCSINHGFVAVAE